MENGVNCIESSLIAGYLRKACRRYQNMESVIGRIYRNSCIYKLTRNINHGIKINFRRCFLGRLTEIDNGLKADILENSEFAAYLLKMYAGLRDKAGKSLADSHVMHCVRSLRQELSLYPLQTCGLVTTITIATNSILSLLLHREINYFGWVMRILFFSLGLASLYSHIGWKKLEETSRVLAYLKAKEKK